MAKVEKIFEIETPCLNKDLRRQTSAMQLNKNGVSQHSGVETTKGDELDPSPESKS